MSLALGAGTQEVEEQGVPVGISGTGVFTSRLELTRPARETVLHGDRFQRGTDSSSYLDSYPIPDRWYLMGGGGTSDRSTLSGTVSPRFLSVPEIKS